MEMCLVTLPETSCKGTAHSVSFINMFVSVNVHDFQYCEKTRSLEKEKIAYLSEVQR